jgi:hypothetical protein
VPAPTPQSLPGADVEPVPHGPDFRYPGVRVRRLESAEIVPGQPPTEFLSVQYLLDTEYGVLAVTFATPQVEIFDEEGKMLFMRIASASKLERASER